MIAKTLTSERFSVLKDSLVAFKPYGVARSRRG